MEDQKILGQIDKLLSRYGVSDEEKQNFLNDLKDYKEDEEEVVADEQPTEQVGEEKSAEEIKSADDEIETTDEEKVEESTDDPQPEETPAEEEVVKEDEIVGSEETVEDKVEEKVEETTPQESIDWESKFGEMQKAYDGLVARFTALEDIVSKLGVPAEDQEQFGKSPNAESTEEEHDDFITELNRKRMGY